MDTGLLLLRSVVGLTLLAHGAQKFSGLDAAATAFEGLGFVPGRRSAILAALAEAGGGLLLALGLLTPIAASIVFGVMLVAGGLHLKAGFFAQKGGYEYTLVLGLAGLSVAFTGPGRFSVDALLGLDLGGLHWGLLALAAGVVGGAIQLAARRRPEAAPNKA
jgi:putative oxidoreductase